jgi:hypothetical protein
LVLPLISLYHNKLDVIKRSYNISEANIGGLCPLIENESWIYVIQENDVEEN